MTYYKFYNRLRAIGRMVDYAVFAGVEINLGEYGDDDEVSAEDARETLRPILEALDGLALDVVGREVPKLVWRDFLTVDVETSKAGTYSVYKGVLSGSWWAHGDQMEPEAHDSREAAKAACQAHYEANQ